MTKSFLKIFVDKNTETSQDTLRVMESLESQPILKCKKCKDVFLATHLKNHGCFASDSEKRGGTDLNRQCCVLDGDVPCSNSILCRVHSLDEKKKIKNRLYPVNLLIQILKNENKNKKVVTEIVTEKISDLDLKKVYKIINELQPVIVYNEEEPNEKIKKIFEQIKSGKEEQQMIKPPEIIPPEQPRRKKRGPNRLTP